MSLIVDINPVPWEILDRVKARLLKNRANRQKRQPEKGKELRRVMRVDNGILAKQRWEEPSFIFGSETRSPFIVVVVGGPDSRKIPVDRPLLWFYDRFRMEGPGAPFSYGPDPSGAGGWYAGMWYPNYIKQYYDWVTSYGYSGSPVYEDIRDIEVRLSDITITTIPPPGLDTFVAYLFTWTTDANTQNNIKQVVENAFYKERLASREYTITTTAPTRSSPPEDVLTPDPAKDINRYLITLNWVTIILNEEDLNEPEVDDQLQLQFVPSIISPQAYTGNMNNLGKLNTAIHYGFVDSFEQIVTIDPLANLFIANEHNFEINDIVSFYATQGDLPTPLEELQRYYVRSEGLTENTFTVASQYNGQIVDINGPANGIYVVNARPITRSASTAINSIKTYSLKFL